MNHKTDMQAAFDAYYAENWPLCKASIEKGIAGEEITDEREALWDTWQDAWKAALASRPDAQADELKRLREIARLIGSIFVHGNFKAETYNERALEKLLREQGCFFESLADYDAARAAAPQAEAAQGVPEGWKLVPIEPTAQMLRAGDKAMTNAGPLRTATLTYCAMLAAAPAPVSEPDDVPEGCTPADAEMLRSANHYLAAENDRLRRRLRPFAQLANSPLSWAMVEYCIDGDPEKQTLQAPQMQRAFNRAAEALREDVAEQPKQSVPALLSVPAPLSEYHEDTGPVVWWTWQDGLWLGEPAWIGMPDDSDWPGYHTHWTYHPEFPLPPLAEQPSTGICFFCGAPIDGEHESDCPQGDCAEQPSEDEASLCERIIHAVEGECDGLAITEEQASNILAYLQYGTSMRDMSEAFHIVDNAIGAAEEYQPEDGNLRIVTLRIDAARKVRAALASQTAEQPSERGNTAPSPDREQLMPPRKTKS